MSDPSIDQVLAFNSQLAALSAAGVRFDLGVSGRSINTVLEQANENLQLRTSLGQSVGDALAEDRQLPAVYRCAVNSGLLPEQPTLILDSLSRVPATSVRMRRTIGHSFLQPLVLFSLAYFGFVGMCSYFAPSLAGIYDQLQHEKHWSLRLLLIARQWMPVWIPAVPVIIAMMAWYWRRSTTQTQLWMPRSKQYARTMRHASFAEQLSMLLEQNVPLPDALRTVGGISGNEPLGKTTDALAIAAEHEETLPPDDQRLSSLPPLLRWALTGDLAGQKLPEVLHFVADTYRQQAQQKVAFWQVAWPLLIGGLLGGAVVFVYGLCVFGPYALMLKDISQ